MAWLEGDTYLLAFDAKGDASLPRFGVLEPGAARAPQALDVDWSALREPAYDVESLCRVPGAGDTFYAAESGSCGPDFRRVFEVALHRDGLRWRATVTLAFMLPPDVENVEGIACRLRADGARLFLFAERGGSERTPRATLRWGVVGTSGQAPDFGGPDELVPPAPADASWRGVSDLLLDDDGSLLAAASDDGGNAGPFRSIVWRIGRASDGGVELEPAQALLHTIDGFKVEAVARTAAGALCIGTDDERLGGTWRELKP